MGPIVLIVFVGYLLQWTIEQPKVMASIVLGYALTFFLIFGVLQLQNWPQPLGIITGGVLGGFGPSITDRAYKLLTGKKGG